MVAAHKTYKDNLHGLIEADRIPLRLAGSTAGYSDTIRLTFSGIEVVQLYREAYREIQRGRKIADRKLTDIGYGVSTGAVIGVVFCQTVLTRPLPETVAFITQSLLIAAALVGTSGVVVSSIVRARRRRSKQIYKDQFFPDDPSSGVTGRLDENAPADPVVVRRYKQRFREKVKELTRNGRAPAP